MSDSGYGDNPGGLSLAEMAASNESMNDAIGNPKPVRDIDAIGDQQSVTPQITPDKPSTEAATSLAEVAANNKAAASAVRSAGDTAADIGLHQQAALNAEFKRMNSEFPAAPSQASGPAYPATPTKAQAAGGAWWNGQQPPSPLSPQESASLTKAQGPESPAAPRPRFDAQGNLIAPAIPLTGVVGHSAAYAKAAELERRNAELERRNLDGQNGPSIAAPFNPQNPLAGPVSQSDITASTVAFERANPQFDTMYGVQDRRDTSAVRAAVGGFEAPFNSLYNLAAGHASLLTHLTGLPTHVNPLFARSQQAHPFASGAGGFVGNAALIGATPEAKLFDAGGMADDTVGQMVKRYVAHRVGNAAKFAALNAAETAGDGGTAGQVAGSGLYGAASGFLPGTSIPARLVGAGAMGGLTALTGGSPGSIAANAAMGLLGGEETPDYVAPKRVPFEMPQFADASGMTPQSLGDIISQQAESGIQATPNQTAFSIIDHFGLENTADIRRAALMLGENRDPLSQSVARDLINIDDEMARTGVTQLPPVPPAATPAAQAPPPEPEPMGTPAAVAAPEPPKPLSDHDKLYNASQAMLHANNNPDAAGNLLSEAENLRNKTGRFNPTLYDRETLEGKSGKILRNIADSFGLKKGMSREQLINAIHYDSLARPIERLTTGEIRKLYRRPAMKSGGDWTPIAKDADRQTAVGLYFGRLAKMDVPERRAELKEIMKHVHEGSAAKNSNSELIPLLNKAATEGRLNSADDVQTVVGHFLYARATGARLHYERALAPETVGRTGDYAASKAGAEAPTPKADGDVVAPATEPVEPPDAPPADEPKPPEPTPEDLAKLRAIHDEMTKRAATTRETIPQSPIPEAKPADEPASMFGEPVKANPARDKHGHLIEDTVPVSSLTLRPEDFQFRRNVNKRGVSLSAKEDGNPTGVKFNQDRAPHIGVWRNPEDGKTYVVNGHHRYDMAVKSGTKMIKVKYYDAANIAEARQQGALDNIAENSGNSMDFATFLRGVPDPVRLLKKSDIDPDAAKVKEGLAISRLPDQIFNMVKQGELSPRRGAALSELVPDHDQQISFMNSIAKDKGKYTDEDFDKMLAVFKMAGGKEGMGDMFGNTSWANNMLIWGKLAAHVQSELEAEASGLKFGSNEKKTGRLRRRGVIGESDTERSKNELVLAKDDLARYNLQETSKGAPVAKILSAMAEKVGKGGKGGIKLEQAKDQVYEQIRNELDASRERESKGVVGKKSAGDDILPPGGHLGRDVGKVQETPDRMGQSRDTLPGDDGWPDTSAQPQSLTEAAAVNKSIATPPAAEVSDALKGKPPELTPAEKRDAMGQQSESGPSGAIQIGRIGKRQAVSHILATVPEAIRNSSKSVRAALDGVFNKMARVAHIHGPELASLITSAKTAHQQGADTANSFKIAAFGKLQPSDVMGEGEPGYESLAKEPEKIRQQALHLFVRLGVYFRRQLIRQSVGVTLSPETIDALYKNAWTPEGLKWAQENPKQFEEYKLATETAKELGTMTASEANALLAKPWMQDAIKLFNSSIGAQIDNIRDQYGLPMDPRAKQIPLFLNLVGEKQISGAPVAETLSKKAPFVKRATGDNPIESNPQKYIAKMVSSHLAFHASEQAGHFMETHVAATDNAVFNRRDALGVGDSKGDYADAIINGRKEVVTPMQVYPLGDKRNGGKILWVPLRIERAWRESRMNHDDEQAVAKIADTIIRSSLVGVGQYHIIRLYGLVAAHMARTGSNPLPVYLFSRIAAQHSMDEMATSPFGRVMQSHLVEHGAAQGPYVKLTNIFGHADIEKTAEQIMKARKSGRYNLAQAVVNLKNAHEMMFHPDAGINVLARRQILESTLRAIKGNRFMDEIKGGVNSGKISEAEAIDRIKNALTPEQHYAAAKNVNNTVGWSNHATSQEWMKAAPGHVRLIPFISSESGTIPEGFRKFINVSPANVRASLNRGDYEQALRQVAGGLASGAVGWYTAANLVNYATTGHFMWQNPSGHRLQLALSHGLYLTTSGPEMTRTLRLAGVNFGANNESYNMLSDVSQIPRQFINEGLSMIHPFWRLGVTAFSAAFGKPILPYLNQNYAPAGSSYAGVAADVLPLAAVQRTASAIARGQPVLPGIASDVVRTMTGLNLSEDAHTPDVDALNELYDASHPSSPQTRDSQLHIKLLQALKSANPNYSGKGKIDTKAIADAERDRKISRAEGAKLIKSFTENNNVYKFKQLTLIDAARYFRDPSVSRATKAYLRPLFVEKYNNRLTSWDDRLRVMKILGTYGKKVNGVQVSPIPQYK